ncbi:hypothetical protein MSAN_01697900 [Mycena sanguinolenta]|uniref:Uncharacterized protein n=1 Tax=Mycena sanguinolenta TaxID=230812 RepID=A0A8H6Y026_9AGAR|nr:hypothetical protein MSAN_01697900 [Mycena sanguinolenta]
MLFLRFSTLLALGAIFTANSIAVPTPRAGLAPQQLDQAERNIVGLNAKRGEVDSALTDVLENVGKISRPQPQVPPPPGPPPPLGPPAPPSPPAPSDQPDQPGQPAPRFLPVICNILPFQLFCPPHPQR